MDKQKLHDKLTDAFITYQHRLENPMPSPTESRAALILKYRNDPIFHSKVASIVAAIINIVGECEAKP